MVVVFDLDDTLYDEVDFIKSGFQEVANYLNNQEYYNFMINIFNSYGGKNIFDKLITYFNLSVDINKLIEIYRFHEPNIHMSSESIELLNFAKSFKTGIISDGHYIMQMNKYKALELNTYIDYPIFTDFYHTKKPESRAYQMMMEKFNNERIFVYIADNPQKDFIALQELGWIGIRYKNPIGIYRNIKSNTDYEIETKRDIMKILKNLDNG